MGTGDEAVADVGKYKYREVVEFPLFTLNLYHSDEPVPEKVSKQWLMKSERLRGYLLAFHYNRTFLQSNGYYKICRSIANTS